MAGRLPPLNALRAFEAAARHLSFTQAAAELFVTQAAISHQIKTLEEWLGLKLFRRMNRRLLLTDEGQAYMAPIRDALSSIAAATDRLKRSETEGLLTVSAMTSFAATWLLPRLGQFSRLHPEIDIRVDVRDDLTDFSRDGVDVALRYGTGDYPDLASKWFLAEEAFPVCSPKLVEEGPHPLRTPEDLKHHTLIHDFTERLWDRWLELAGVSGVDTDHGPSFNLLNLAIDAAIAGGGVALGRSAIVQGALDDGRLVKPFDLMMPSANSYFFVCPQEIAERPKIVAFRDWIVEQADS
ncbi:MAG: transcriptional regulator GcvA [Alphaproteobacteria bacterium]|jgi:LysR family transcriptional regulator, glycine cleavage system transcriptional activator|nr:transcriptional regulator GcvA [Alphaproteobacteria bacterium]